MRTYNKNHGHYKKSTNKRLKRLLINDELSLLNQVFDNLDDTTINVRQMFNISSASKFEPADW